MDLQELEQVIRRVTSLDSQQPLLAASGSGQPGYILPTEFHTAAETLMHRLSDDRPQHDAPPRPSIGWF